MIMNSSWRSSATPMLMHVNSCAEVYMQFSDKHYNMASSPWREKPVWVPVADKRNPKDPEFLTGGQSGRIYVSIHELSKNKEPKGHLPSCIQHTYS